MILSPYFYYFDISFNSHPSILKKIMLIASYDLCLLQKEQGEK